MLPIHQRGGMYVRFAPVVNADYSRHQRCRADGRDLHSEVRPNDGISDVRRDVIPADLNTIFLPVVFGSPFDLAYQLYANFTITTFGAGWLGDGKIILNDPPLIAIYDANMNPLPNARLVSQAGVNYGLAEDVAPATVPELLTIGLLGLGLVRAAVVRYRRRR